MYQLTFIIFKGITLQEHAPCQSYVFREAFIRANPARGNRVVGVHKSGSAQRLCNFLFSAEEDVLQRHGGASAPPPFLSTSSKYFAKSVFKCSRSVKFTRLSSGKRGLSVWSTKTRRLSSWSHNLCAVACLSIKVITSPLLQLPFPVNFASTHFTHRAGPPAASDACTASRSALAASRSWSRQQVFQNSEKCCRCGFVRGVLHEICTRANQAPGWPAVSRLGKAREATVAAEKCSKQLKSILGARATRASSRSWLRTPSWCKPPPLIFGGASSQRTQKGFREYPISENM